MYRFKPLKIALLILLFGLIEASFLANLLFEKIKVELLLMLVVFVSFYSFKKTQRYFTAFFSGLLKDTFSSLPLGLNILIFTLLVFLIEKISKNFFKENKLTFSIFVFFISSILNIIWWVFSFGFREISFSNALLSSVLPSGVTSALACFLVFSFLKAILIEHETK